MKKITLFAAALFTAVSFTSCDNNAEEAIVANTPIKVNVTIDNFEQGSTRAVKSSWANGDKINIWFNSANPQTSPTPQLILTYKDGEWESGTAPASDVLGTSGTLCALYEASNAIFDDPNRQPLVLVFQQRFKDGKIASSWVYQNPMMLFSSAMAYTVVDNTLNIVIKDWIRTCLNQVIIKGLDTTDPSRYVMKVCSTNGGDYDNSGLVSVKTLQIAQGVAKLGTNTPSDWIAGVNNVDGVAFCYGTAKLSGDQSYTFKLYDRTTAKHYEYVATGTFNEDGKKTKGIWINFSKFSEKE